MRLKQWAPHHVGCPLAYQVGSSAGGGVFSMGVPLQRDQRDTSGVGTQAVATAPPRAPPERNVLACQISAR